jgi:HEAT repeats
VRVAVVRALGRIGLPDKEAVPILVGALKDSNDDVFTAALQGLGRLGPRAKGSIPHLLPLLKNASLEKRVSVCLVLGFIGRSATDAVSALDKTAKSDAEPAVRLLALAALAKIDPSRLKDALPRLTAALKTKDEKQLEAAQVGVFLLGRDALPSLRALREQVSDMRLRAGIDEIIQAIEDPKKSAFSELWK